MKVTVRVTNKATVRTKNRVHENGPVFLLEKKQKQAFGLKMHFLEVRKNKLGWLDSSIRNRNGESK